MDIPDKSFIIYDADCGFCQASVDRLRSIIGDAIDYVPRLSLKDGTYGISHSESNSSIKFFEHKTNNTSSSVMHDYHVEHPDATVYSAAYAVFQALSYNSCFKFLLILYKYLPGFRLVSEAVYRVIARHRSEISACTVSPPQN